MHHNICRAIKPLHPTVPCATEQLHHNDQKQSRFDTARGTIQFWHYAFNWVCK